MNDLRNKTCLVYDNGLFVELAARLSRDFGRVLYYCPWKSAFPKRIDAAIGEGVPGIEVVRDFWDMADQVDLFIFPDVYDGDLQTYLRTQGKRVWGSGKAESLELARWGTRQMQDRIGVAAPSTVKLTGLRELRQWLAKNPNQWVKVSKFRGDVETFKAKNLFTVEPLLTDLEQRYGALAGSMEFIVEENIEGVELGYDGFTVDGEFPDKALFGYEVKDLGYIGKVKPYDELPQQVRDVNAAFAPILQDQRCRSFLSFEMRINEQREPLVIDPCMRCGSPPTEVNMELWANLAEILWHGAAGEMVSPEPMAQWAVMAMIHSPWAVGHWTPLAIPEDARQWVKLRNLTVVDGKNYFVPQDVPLPEIGAVVGLGDSLEEAIAKVDEIAERVEGHQVTIHNDSFQKAQEAIEEGERYGIEF